MTHRVFIEESWSNLLKEEFEKPYFEEMRVFVRNEYKKKTIYPKGSDIFRAFNSTPVNKVKVVIIGQDPYHGKGQAHGLAFSVQNGMTIPPSLVNIFNKSGLSWFLPDVEKQFPTDTLATCLLARHNAFGS